MSAVAVGAYFGSRALGFSEYVSLLNATVVALLRVVYVAVSRRRFDGFSATRVLVFGTGLAVSLVVGDAALLLAVRSVRPAALALALLASCLLGRPPSWWPSVSALRTNRSPSGERCCIAPCRPSAAATS